MTRYPLVEIEWIDSAFNPGWHKADTVRDVAYCKTTGYLVEKNKKRINVAMNVADNGDYGEAMAIPRSCVTKIRKL